MTRLAWLPYPSREVAEARIGSLPPGIAADYYTGDPAAMPNTIADVEFFIIPYQRESGQFAGAEQLARVGEMTRLRVVQTLTAGVDNFRPHIPDGVTLCNAAGVHDASTAELAVALTLASGRQIDVHARNQSTGTWATTFGTSLADRRVLLVGYGRIGAAIEQRLAGFEIASLTRVARRARDGDVVVHAATELMDLLPDADVVILVVPLTSETHAMMDAAALARLPNGALVVNVGRGKLLDTDALLSETASGRLRAALDVTDPEPLPSDHPLWRTPGVLITPHVGGPSTAFFPRADRLIAEQLRRFGAEEKLENVVP